MARKIRKRNKMESGTSSPVHNRSIAPARITVPSPLFIIIYALTSLGVILLMRTIYVKLDNIKTGLDGVELSQFIGILQYIVASMAPAILIAFLFTIVEIILTKRQRVTTPYFVSFIKLILSFGGFVAAVFIFEQALDWLGIEPLWDVDAATFGSVWTYLIAMTYFFISDVLLYWVHRLEHKNKALWYLHKIHHAVEDMDSVSGAFHPLSTIIRWVFTILPLSFFIEINLGDTLVFAAFLSGVHFVQHTRAPLSFGWFGKIIGDNKFHFVHHSKNPKQYNKNFAAIFPVIDMIFGTYLEPSKNNLPETGLDHLKGAETVKQFLSGKLQPR